MIPMIPWYRQKTTWAAITGVLTALGGYLAGEISLGAFIGAIFAALAFIFDRQGTEKLKRVGVPRFQDRGETPEGSE